MGMDGWRVSGCRSGWGWGQCPVEGAGCPHSRQPVFSGCRGLPRCYWTQNSTQASSRTMSALLEGPPSTPCTCWRVGVSAPCSSTLWRPPASAHGGPLLLPAPGPPTQCIRALSLTRICSVIHSVDVYRARAWLWARHGEPRGSLAYGLQCPSSCREGQPSGCSLCSPRGFIICGHQTRVIIQAREVGPGEPEGTSVSLTITPFSQPGWGG